MRGWMNEGKSYIPPVGIGEVMRAGGIGRVIASENEAFPGQPRHRRPRRAGLLPGAGRHDQAQRPGEASTRGLGSVSQWLNVLGMPGMTGYWGLMDVGQPKAGETVVVSGAAGRRGPDRGADRQDQGLPRGRHRRRRRPSASGW